MTTKTPRSVSICRETKYLTSIYGTSESLTRYRRSTTDVCWTMK